MLEVNWTNIGGGSSVEEWKPKKQYNNNDLVINDNKLYLCIQKNMSTDSFEDDSNYWVLLSATEHNNYGQVNKLGAKKGDTFDVSVQKTSTFSFPPVEVLKLSGVTKGVSKNIFDYDSGDGKRFTINNTIASKSKLSGGDVCAAKSSRCCPAGREGALPCCSASLNLKRS